MMFLGFVFFILALVGIVGSFFIVKKEEKLISTIRKLSSIVALIGLFLIFKPFEFIPSGSKGLIFTFGAISNKVVEPGLAFKIPIVQNIKIITIRPMQINHQVEVGSGGAITKDNQTIGSNMTIFYKYNENDLVNMFKNFGEDKIKNVLVSSAIESFKAEIGNHDIFKLPTMQDEIRSKTFQELKSKMTSYPIEITELKITNYDWSEEFDKQIATTMERAQQVKQKEQELLITEQEAQKQVKEAEAGKQSLILKAEGEKAAAELMAQAKALEGEGIKKYNESVQRNMQLEIELRKLEIEKIKAERWNGQYVPTNNYGPIPFVQGSIQK